MIREVIFFSFPFKVHFAFPSRVLCDLCLIKTLHSVKKNLKKSGYGMEEKSLVS